MTNQKHELGQNWIAEFNPEGSLLISNEVTQNFIVLNPSSVQTLKNIFKGL